jgi:hypothetical protein
MPLAREQTGAVQAKEKNGDRRRVLKTGRR